MRQAHRSAVPVNKLGMRRGSITNLIRDIAPG